MNPDHPIPEHEGALFDAVCVLAACWKWTPIQNVCVPLTAARDAADGLRNRHGAATLRFLIGSLFPAAAPPPKPSFRVV